jgi:hypothetical protein
VSTYEEWLVTGADEEGDPVSITWDEDDPEQRARAFAAWVREHDWTDGLHLHKRTVTVTDWQEIEP